ncbi:hypothetical protein T4D_11120 [Trichinella pseudospiralis]|uniref:Uncharacterized protein n=1 Tax=Trichinella pseudospiralis TaxID=6337 RepID=A0A0V1FDQ3_TRIPS|nr:hypothetical protein T4D_11120 [Trichinella pseudospiralis]
MNKVIKNATNKPESEGEVCAQLQKKSKVDKVIGNALLYSHPASSTHQMKIVKGVEELKLREHRPTNRPTATTTTAAALWRIRVCSKAVGKACAMLRGSDQGASKIRRSSSLRNH